MTPAGWLRDHVGDGSVTILIAGKAHLVRKVELVDLVRRRLRLGATVTGVNGEDYHGLVRTSRDGSRYWIDLGPQLAFVWACDLHALLAGEMITAEIHPVMGMLAVDDEAGEPLETMNTVPAMSTGRPLHA